ncbi:MAG TPA: serine/threonine-protein kinase [Myxococcota bacterium]
MTTTDAADELIGRVVADRYEVVRKLNEGGVGAVYLAIQRPLDRPVALKVLLKKHADDVTAIRRFEKEAAAVARLAHAHIVTLYDFGSTDDGDLFLAMELLRGQSLRELLDAAGYIPWERSLHIIQGVTRALVAAHTQKIVHRDLKPENIMLVESNGDLDFAKVLDFGLARSMSGGTGPQITRHDVVAGTPSYMAPERANGIADDPRSDLYALGALWFELLVGRAPFVGETSIKVILRHVHEAPLRPSLANADNPIPPFIDALILELLNKLPEERPSSARVLLDRLDTLARPAGWHVSPPGDLSRRGDHDSSLREFSTAAADPGLDLRFSVEKEALDQPVALTRRKSSATMPSLSTSLSGLSGSMSSLSLSSSLTASLQASLAGEATLVTPLPPTMSTLQMPPTTPPPTPTLKPEPLLLTRKKTAPPMGGVGVGLGSAPVAPVPSSAEAAPTISRKAVTTEEVPRRAIAAAAAAASSSSSSSSSSIPPPVIDSVAKVAGWLSQAKTTREVAELCVSFLASRFDRAAVLDLRAGVVVVAGHGLPQSLSSTASAVAPVLPGGPVLELAARREAYYGPAMTGSSWLSWFGAVGGPVPGAVFVGGLGREGSTAFVFYADHKDRVLRPAVKDTVVLLREAAAALSEIG